MTAYLSDESAKAAKECYPTLFSAREYPKIKFH